MTIIFRKVKSNFLRKRNLSSRSCVKQQIRSDGHSADEATLRLLLDLLSLSFSFLSCWCGATAGFSLLRLSAATGGNGGREGKKALATPHADPVKRDRCWTETFPSEVEVEVHAQEIFNRDGVGGVISKFWRAARRDRTASEAKRAKEDHAWRWW